MPMVPLKIGIVEDDLLIAESIFVSLKELGYNPVKPVRNYDSALMMLRTEKPDFLIIDIRIDGTADGIDLADTVNKEFQVPFIFLTGNSDNGTINRAKLVNPGAYLLKPFTKIELFTSIEIAFNNFNNGIKRQPSARNKKLDNFIFIKERDVFYKIVLADILYVESDNVYVSIHTDQKVYITRNKLSNFLEEYGQESFLRVHRSYAINLVHVQSINNFSVKVGGKEIPITKNYRQELFDKVNLWR